MTDEMVEGYFDGLRDDRSAYPEQSNRSEQYRHGWLNGRDDRLRQPRATAAQIREEAERLTCLGEEG